MTPKQTPTLGNGMLFEVHRNRQRMIQSMERRTCVKLLSAIALCVALIVWNLFG